MPIVRLTTTNLRTLPPIGGRRTDYTDALLPGFVLRVSPTGARAYGVAAWDGNRKRRVAIGSVERWELAKARDRARDILRDLEAGQEPAPLPTTKGLTVTRLVGDCLAELQLRPTTRREWERLLRVEIAPALGARPAAGLRRAEVREWARAVRKRSGYTATHAFEVLRRAYSWAVREEVLENNPCAGMARPFEGQASERVLSAPEVWALLRCLDRGQRHHALYVDATRLLLLTGVRRAAVLGLQRVELHNLDGLQPRWVVPRERSKSGDPHVIPLSATALEVVRRRLGAVRTEHLFPLGLHRKVERPATWTGRWRTWLRARVQRVADAGRRRAGLPPEPVPRWTIHGLRHTVATHLREDLGVPRDVVGMILGHTPPGPRATRIYDRAAMLPERRAALDAWARWLQDLRAAGPGAMGGHEVARFTPASGERTRTGGTKNE